MDNLLFTSIVLRRYHHHHHLHNHHVLITEMGHFVTRFGLTHPELSSIDFHVSSCLLICSFLLSCVTCYEPFCSHVYYISPAVLYFVLNWGYVGFLCNPCISHMFHLAVVLLASLAWMVQLSLLHNETGRHSVLYSLILLVLKFPLI